MASRNNDACRDMWDVAHRLLVGLSALLVHEGARARLLALARLKADDASGLDHQARCLGARSFGGTGLCRRHAIRPSEDSWEQKEIADD